MQRQLVRSGWGLAVAVSIVATGAAYAGGSTAPVGATPTGAAQPYAIDDEPDCLQIPPERAVLPVPDGGQRLPMSVAVLVATSELSTAKKRNAVTAKTLAGAGLDLRFVYYTVKKMPTFGTSGAGVATAVVFAKQHFKGRAPAGTHAVLMLTQEFKGRGYSDCIGGALYPDRAFAVAGLYERPKGLSNNRDDGVIAAHELGHLLGAQHHHGNCAEAQPQAIAEEDLNSCTLMSMFAATRHLGTLERAYIRDYARRLTPVRRAAGP